MSLKQALQDRAPFLTELAGLGHAGEQALVRTIARTLGEEAAAGSPDRVANDLREYARQLDRADQKRLFDVLNLAGGALAASVVAGSADALERFASRAVAAYFSSDEDRQRLGRFSLARTRPDLLERIQAEAVSQRASAVRHKRAFFGAPDDAAAEWLADRKTRTQLEALELSLAGPGSYIYYETEGDGVVPHVDIPEFKYNLLLLVHSEGVMKDDSGLHMIGRDLVSRNVSLEVGDYVILSTGYYFHYRTPLGPDQRTTMLTIGLSDVPCDEHLQR